MTGPALKPTEEQVIEHLKHIRVGGLFGELIHDLISDWRTLRAALASANNEITERKAIVALREYVGADRYSRDYEYCNAQLLPKMRAALLAAQGKQPEEAPDHSRPCAEMSVDELRTEDVELDRVWKRMREDLDESGGSSGSPGEWIVERSEEIATELKRRAPTSAPQSPDQACGAESNQAFVARIVKEHGPIDDPWHLTSEEGKRLIALVSRPDTALVRELAEALEPLAKASQVFLGPDKCLVISDTELRVGDLRRAARLLARPDVIAARKGGGE